MLDGTYSVSYFEYILKEHGLNIDKLSVRIYVNKIENRVKFKTKNGCSIEHLTPETMKLLGSTKKITKDKNGKNVQYLEITEVVLVHCNIINNIQKSYTRLFQTNRLVVYEKFLPQIISF